MKRSRTVVLSMVCAVLLGACASGGDDTSSDSTEDAGATVDEAAANEGSDEGTETAEAADEGLDRDATFRWSYTLSPGSMDPHKSASEFDAYYHFPVYDRLVWVNPAGETVPMLATEWDIVDDGAALKMKLREDVTFHDGEPFDADAVVANIERGLNLPESTVTSDLAVVKGAEAVDSHTVRILLSGPGGALPNILSGRAGMMISPAAFDKPDLDRMPVGAGPYVVTAHDDGERVVYDRYEDYWDPEAQRVATMEFLDISDDDTRMNALRSGQIDVALTRESDADLLEEWDVGLKESVRPSFYQVLVNNQQVEAFNDERVRRAMNHAINREAIGDSLYNGRCTPTTNPFPAEHWAHSPAIGEDPYFEYDPELAQELLDEAGYGDGFSFEMLSPSTTGYVTLAEVLQEQFSQVGIDMSVRPLETAQVREGFIAEKSADAMLGAFPPASDPSGAVAATWLEDSAQNPGGLVIDGVPELHTEAMTPIDIEERAPLYHDLIQRVVEQAASPLVICMRNRVDGYNDDRVVGLEHYANGVYEFRGIGIRAGAE